MSPSMNASSSVPCGVYVCNALSSPMIVISEYKSSLTWETNHCYQIETGPYFVSFASLTKSRHDSLSPISLFFFFLFLFFLSHSRPRLFFPLSLPLNDFALFSTNSKTEESYRKYNN